MRIAYVCADPGVPVFGNKGCSIHVQEMLRAMLDRGAEIELFAARVGGESPDDLKRCVVHELALSKCRNTRDRESEQIQWNRRVVEVLAKRSCFDLIYERHSIWSADAICWAAQQGIPSILEVNSPLIDEQSTYRKLVQAQMATSLTRRAMENAQLTYVVSKAIVPYCRRFISESQPIYVFANGVNTKRFSPTVAPVSPFNGFTIGFVGSLKPWHGLDGLIDAFIQLASRVARIDDYRLLFVGDGPERQALQTRLQEADLGCQVQFVGAVEADSVPGWINSMDVAVAPYPNLDNFYFSPLKVFEYMASGRAVIASDVGQVSEIIDHGIDGLLYVPDDIGQLIESILTLRDQPALRRKLGLAARNAALRQSWAQVLENILIHVCHSSTQATSSGNRHDAIEA